MCPDTALASHSCLNKILLLLIKVFSYLGMKYNYRITRMTTSISSEAKILRKLYKNSNHRIYKWKKKKIIEIDPEQQNHALNV